MFGSLRTKLAVVMVALAMTTAGCGGTDGSAASAEAQPPTAEANNRGNNGAESSRTLDRNDSSSAKANEGKTVETPAEFPTGIEPVRIEIPGIDVAADVVDLDLRGPEPEVPDDFDDAGWYQQTRRPGEIGPSVIAGHIDSRSGPAVFARLDELELGDEIVLFDRNGARKTFVVDRAEQYRKAGLPREVFGFDLNAPELRLITCGGTFDRSSGHYRDNFVVYASAIGDA